MHNFKSIIYCTCYIGIHKAMLHFEISLFSANLNRFLTDLFNYKYIL